MMKVQLLLAALTFLLWVFCLVGAITAPAAQVRHLPKVAWVILVLLFPLVGSVAWLVAGRPVGSAARRPRGERPAPEFPEYDRPGRAAAADPVKDEEFLRQLRARAEEQRRRYEQSRAPKPDDED